MRTSGASSPSSTGSVARLVLALFATVLFAGCATTDSARAWQYRVLEHWHNPLERDNSLELRLNDAGQEGYKVISATTLPASANTQAKTILIMERSRR